MYKVILKKKSSKHSNLSKDEYEGYTFELPTIGKSFLLVGDTMRLDEIVDATGDPEIQGLGDDIAEGNVQVRSLQVITTPVTLLDQDTYIFSTENSIYQVVVLEVLGLEPEEIQ